MRLPLRTRIVLGTLLTLLPILAILVLTYRNDHQRERDAVLDGLTQTAQTIALAVEATFDEAIVLGRTLGGDPQVRSLDAGTATARLRAVQAENPIYRNLALVDGEGFLVTWSAEEPLPEPPLNVSARAYFREARDARRPVVSDVVQVAQPDGVAAGVAVPMLNGDGSLRGVVTLAFDGAAVGSRLRDIGLRPGESILVADRQARLAFLSDPTAPTWEQRDASAIPNLGQALAGQPVRFVGVPLQAAGAERVGAAVPVPGHGWVVVLSMPATVAFGSLTAAFQQRLLAFAAVAAIAVLGSLWLARSVARPLRDLEGHATALGSGQLGRRAAVTTRDEIGGLAAAFNAMAERLAGALDDLRRSEERFRLASEAIHGLVYDWDFATGATYRSAGLKDVLGFAPDEAEPTADWWTRRVHPDDLRAMQALRDDRNRTRSSTLEGEYRVRHRNGGWIWVREHCRLIFGPDGRPIRAVGSTWSIDAERRAADALRASEQRLQLALQAARMVAWEWDPASNRVALTGNVAEVYGAPPGHGAGDGFALLHPEAGSGHRALVERALRDGSGYRDEFRVIRPDTGEAAWLEERGQAIVGPAGEVERLAGVVMDITARKQIELERAWLAEAVTSSADSVVVRELDGTILAWNPGAERLFGYPAEEMIGRSVGGLVPPERTAEVAEFNRRVGGGERLDQVETVRLRRDGSRVEVAMSLSPIYDEGGRVAALCAIGRDISERKAADRERQRLTADLAAAESRYRHLFGAVGDPLSVADGDGTLVEVNDAMCALVGYPRHELLGMHVSALGTADDQQMRQSQRALAETGTAQVQLELRRKDGTTVTVESVTTVAQLPAGRGYLTVHRDITRRKQLEQMQRDFIANVSHELRNPLTAVRGFAQVMQRRRAYSERAVQAIVRQTGQLERLIGDLLEASRLEARALDLRRQSFDLMMLARAAVEEAQATSDRHVVRLVGPDRPLVGAWDRDRLGQVFRNLLSNALKYSPEGGEVLVRIEDRGDGAAVAIRDSGLGIDADALPRLFDRFYRADADAGAVQGVGLGLYISRELVEAHGGRIWAESAGRGRGSEFHLLVPYAAAADEDQPPAGPEVPPAGSDEAGS